MEPVNYTYWLCEGDMNGSLSTTDCRPPYARHDEGLNIFSYPSDYLL